MGRGFPNIEVSEEALFVESENLAIRLASAWDRLADCLLSAAIRDAMERVCSDERLFVNAWANWADCLLSSAVREAKALACLIRSVDCLSNAVVRDAVSVVCSRAFCDVSVGCSGCFETVGRAAFFSFCSSAVEGGGAGEVGAIAFPPFVPVAEEEDICCTADNLWGLSPLFGEYGCSVSAVSVSTDCRTGRSVKEKQTVRSAVSGNASKILNFDRRFCLFRAIMIRRFLMSE